MAVLTQTQRTEVWAEAMQWLSGEGISVAIDKVAMADVIAALDDGIGDSVGMVDAFLGEYAAAFDIQTKFRLFAMVVARRLAEGI